MTDTEEPSWARIVREMDEERAENEALFQKRLATHQEEYRCEHPNCVNKSKGPEIEHISGESQGWGGYDREGSFSPPTQDHDIIHWDRPIGLFECRVCGGWFCSNHIVSGVCQDCK